MASSTRRRSASSAAAAVMRRSPDLSPMLAPTQFAPQRAGTARPAFMATQTRAQQATADDDASKGWLIPSPLFSAGPSSPSFGAVRAPQQPPTAEQVASVRFAYRDQVHSLLLSPDLSADEAQNILRAVFRVPERVVGAYEPQRAIIFPLSLVTMSPMSFGEATYYLVLEQSGVQRPYGAELSSPEPSPQASPESSAQSSPQRPVRPQRSAVPQQQQQRMAPPRSVHAAYARAQELSRIAAASPGASDLDASEEEDEFSEDDDVEEEKGSEVDEAAREAEEDAQFEAAVERALAKANAEKAARQLQQQPNGVRGSRRSSLTQQQQQPQQHQPQRQQQRQQQQEGDRQLEERLLRELGDFGPLGSQRRADTQAVSDEADRAEALRQAFWERERERHWLEAERRVLEAEAAKLAEQREALRAREAMQQRQQQVQQQTQRVQEQHEAQADAALRNKARRTRANATTALKSAVGGRVGRTTVAQYSTFDSAEEDEDDAAEDSDVGSDLPDDYPYAAATAPVAASPSDFSQAAVGAAASRFVLSGKERAELEELQQKTGFASVSPAALLGLFHAAAGPDGTLERSRFDAASQQFLKMAQLRDEPSRAKALLVLNRLFDLFDVERDGTVDFAQFATALSVMCQGDRDARVQLAFAAFDSQHSGWLSFSDVESYFFAFFTVIMDLSESLKQAVLNDTTCAELARATTRALFAAAGRRSQINFNELRAWYSAQEDAPGGRIVRDSEDEEDEEQEEEEEEEEYSDEDDEAFEEETVARATQEARFLAAKMQQELQRQQLLEAYKQQAAGASTQQQLRQRPRAQR